MRISPFARSYIRKRTGEIMTDQCEIYRPGPLYDVVYDPVTRTATNQPRTPYHQGPCRLWEIPGGGSVEVGGESIITTQTWLSLPYDAPIPEPEDQVRITVSDDPSLVGKHVKILNVIRGGGLRSSRRMSVQVLDSKKDEW